MQTVYITKRAHLKIEKEQLVIEGHYKVHVPVEDISSLVIESQQVTVTSACLSLLARNGCNVIVCDGSHKPCALQLPFQPYSRQALVNRQQLKWTEAFKKRCHQKIIRKKIENQFRAYELLYKESHEKLKQLASDVKLGDKTHMEALAASIYFSHLLDGESRQNKEYYYNKALNYGYAIMRSAIAQALTASGFIPSVGLFHKSELNNFNLADDIIEPYRPFVDYHVFSSLKEEHEELFPNVKSGILKITEMEIPLEGKNFTTISQSIKKSVHSLREASENYDVNLLYFPYLQPMKERIYE